MISCDTFCELMRSFNLTPEEEAQGCWTDERLLDHFMKIHFKYKSGLDVSEDKEITEEMFYDYIDGVCRLKGQSREAVTKLYHKHFSECKTLTFETFV